MRKMLKATASVLVLAMALVLVPALARADCENTWSSETVGASIDFDTLSVDEGEFYAGEQVHVSLECVSETVTSIELYFSSYGNGMFSIILLDEDGDGTFEGDVTVLDSMSGMYFAHEVHVYSGDRLIAEITSDTIGGAYQLYADFHDAHFTVGSTEETTAKPYVDTLTGTISQTTAKPGDVLTLSFEASSANGMSTSSSYLKVVYNRDYSVEYDSGGLFYSIEARLEDPDGDGVFEGTIDLAGMKPGSWVVDNIMAYDDAGKSSEYYRDGRYGTRLCPELSSASFTIVGPDEGAETNPPVIDTSSFELVCDRNPVTQGDTIVLRVHVTDDTQVARVEAVLSQVYDDYISSYNRVTFEDKGDGVWEATIPLFHSYPSGYDWTVEAIAAYDTYGNRAGVCHEMSYYKEDYQGGYTVTDMSPFDFKIVEYVEEPEFEIDPASFEVSPNPAEIGGRANVSVKVWGNKIIWYAAVVFTNGTSEFSVDVYNRDDSGTLTGVATLGNYLALGTYHVKSVTVTANDRAKYTFVQEGSGLEGVECDFSATELEIVEATTDHSLTVDTSSIAATPGEAKPGDTVTVSMRFNGDVGFNPWRPISIYLRQSESGSESEVRLHHAGNGLYTGTFQVTDGTVAGLWQGNRVRYWDEFDKQYLYYDARFDHSTTSIDLSGADFTVVKSGSGEGGETPAPDTEPPVFVPEKSGVWPKNALNSSSFRLQLCVEDESGIASRGVTVNYDGKGGRILNRDGNTNNYIWTSANYLPEGEYRATYLVLEDVLGNKVYVVDPSWEGAERFGLTPKVYQDLSMLNFTKLSSGTSFSRLTVSFDELSIYDGTAKTPAVTVRQNGEPLVEGVDYELGWQNNIDAGTAYVWVMGIGEYAGGERRSFNILAASLRDAVIDPIPAQQYDGGTGPQPDVRVTLDGAELVRGRDYDVRYSDNQVVGTATAHVYGIGNYQGVVTAPFEVLPMDISGGTVEAPDAIRDDAELGEVDVTVIVDGKELIARKDYTVAFEKSLEEGVARLTVTGVRACTGTIEHTVRLIRTIDSATVTAPDQVFSGGTLLPEVTVEFEGKTLTAWTDYEPSFSDNFFPGQATVTVTGVGSYAGEAVGTFRIAEPFCDVTPATPHYGDILWMYASGVSRGWHEYPMREYRPTSTVKRQDMAAFLYRMAGSPAYTPTAEDMAMFSDVTTSTPHCREIWWLASTGISTGWVMKDGTCQFRPAGTVKRQDMAAFLYRLAGSPAFTPSDADRARFTDVSASTPHHDEVWWLANTGVTTGFPDGTFGGTREIIRQDMAAFLHRMYDKGLVKY